MLNIKSDCNNYWLFLKKNYETRSYKGTDDYEYILGKKYTFDSYVQNSKNVTIGDFVVFREDNYILGFSTISKIERRLGYKKMRRCPKCNSSSLLERKVLIPRWRCNNPRNKECKFEFEDPRITNDKVTIFESFFDKYKEFEKEITVNDLKNCSATKFSISVQNAIMKLDYFKLNNLLSSD